MLKRLVIVLLLGLPGLVQAAEFPLDGEMRKFTPWTERKPVAAQPSPISGRGSRGIERGEGAAACSDAGVSRGPVPSPAQFAGEGGGS